MGKSPWKIRESRRRQGRSSDRNAGLTSEKGEGKEVCVEKASVSNTDRFSQVSEEPRVKFCRRHG